MSKSYTSSTSEDCKQYYDAVTRSEILNDQYIAEFRIPNGEKGYGAYLDLLFQSQKPNYISASEIMCSHNSKTSSSNLEYEFDVDVIANYLGNAYLEWSRPGIVGHDCKKNIKRGLSMSIPVLKTRLCYDNENGHIYDRKGKRHHIGDSSDEKDCPKSSSCSSYCPKKNGYKKFLDCSSSSSSSCSSDCECNKNKYIKCHVDPKCVFGQKEQICQKDAAFYTQGFALAAIDTVSLKQHNTMQTLTGNAIHIFHELYVSYGKKNYNMLGFYKSINQGIIDSIGKTKLYVELPFLFSHSKGDSIFLNHVQKKKLKVCLKRKPLKRLLHRTSCSVKVIKTCDKKQIEECDIGVKLITFQHLIHQANIANIEKISTENKLVNCFEGISVEQSKVSKARIPINASGVLRALHFAVQTRGNHCHNNHFNYNTELNTEPVCHVKLYYGSKVRYEGPGSLFRDLTNMQAGLNAPAWNMYTIPLTTMLKKSWYTGGVDSTKENITLELQLDKDFSDEKYIVHLLYNTNAILSYEHCSLSSDMNENIIVLKHGRN